jgi:uncharacterized protein
MSRILKYLLLSYILSTNAFADLRSAHRAFESGNYKSAFTQLLPLAEADNVEAQSNLAWLYLNGAGTDKNDEKAALWYKKAAQQGNPFAQYNYAKLCDEGIGVELSAEQAVHWYRQAAMQGQANAQYSLGEMYLDGVGVEPDLIRAYAWIYVVVKGGVNAAEPILEELQLDMSAEEQTQANKLGEELWSKHGSQANEN